MNEHEIPETPGVYYRNEIEIEGERMPTEALFVGGPGNVTLMKVWPIRTANGAGLVKLDFSLN